ncbi:ROK family protein [Pectinatus cerevisiiphilus]|uniref:ROK family protein n=1 Tax=Pectinatus cerevisiiphilus TaxID=86956 RepID=A0A4R3KBX1_9FIRM|nr:ROK family protein [Pectinatus cerevisiiphilus]
MIGIEMIIPFIRIIVTNLSGTLLKNIILSDIEIVPKSFIQQFIKTLTTLKAQYKSYKLGIIGIGFAFPNYNHKTGIIENIPNMQKWNQFPILQELEKCKLDIPFFIQSTVQAATMGKIHFGKANPFEQLVYISGTWGISASMYSNGNLISGQHGFAGRIGHSIIDVNGRQCICGNKGCLEEYASIRALFKKLYPGQSQQHKYIEEILKRVKK